MKRPSFFIVGAPKCGTTSLYSWLRSHPQVCMSRPKEPQFFAQDIFGPQRNILDFDSYLRCFPSSDSALEVGEASTCYLASPGAAAEIMSCNPNARIIAMFRNPVDVMYSLHSERLFSGMEQIADFAEAVESNAVRTWTTGRFKGQPVLRPSYREMVRFTEQLRRYRELFGERNVHVILLDDLAASPDKTYLQVLAFLGLEDDGRREFCLMNGNRQKRSTAIGRLLQDPAGWLRSVARSVLPHAARASLARVVIRLNTVQAPRPPMDAQLRDRLTNEFEADIRQLSTYLKRNLSGWMLDALPGFIPSRAEPRTP